MRLPAGASRLEEPATTTTDAYMTLTQLVAYSTMCERWLREQMRQHHADPLPSYRAGTKVLVRRSEFDGWMQRRRAKSVVKPQNDVVRELLSRLAS